MMMFAANCNRISRVIPFLLAVIMYLGSSDPHLRLAAATVEIQYQNSVLSEPEKNFGVKIVSLRLTAGGHLLDLRFQVLDPEKAKAVLDKNKKAFLQESKSGKTLPVPVTKAGSMRQTTIKPEAGRVYFMLFTNPGSLVREGGSVSLIIGDFRKDGIVVDGSGATPVAADAPVLQKDAEAAKP